MRYLREFWGWYLAWHTHHLFRCRVRFCVAGCVLGVIGTMIGAAIASGRL